MLFLRCVDADAETFEKNFALVFWIAVWWVERDACWRRVRARTAIRGGGIAVKERAWFRRRQREICRLEA